jgi:predicted transcriptional regulator of viral defense system
MTIAHGRPDRRRLFEFAEARRGLFTAAEAMKAGFGRTTLFHAARKGEFLRVAQGLYRLANYPTSLEDRLVEIAAMLGPQAVISHETALEQYRVCDIAPSRIHFTLPRSQRFRLRHIPDAEIHTTEHTVAAEDVAQEHGFRMTTLARSIVVSARIGTDPKQIQMAIRTGRRHGPFTESDLARALENAPQRVREIVPALEPTPMHEGRT